MSRAGRKKRNNVKREPNGRAIRVLFDHGTSRAQMKFEQYGTDGADAIGRAYQAGLLGPEADAIRDTARKIARAYWPMLEIGSYNCTLNERQGGANDNPEDFDGRIKAREQWLTGILRTVDRMGRAHRKAFDDLVIEVHPDSGPKWLERMIYAKKRTEGFDALDAVSLKMAIEAVRKIMA